MGHRTECKNAKTIKFLENNIGESLDIIVFGDDFSDTTPKVQSMKQRIDHLEFIKIKHMQFLFAIQAFNLREIRMSLKNMCFCHKNYVELKGINKKQR